MQILYILLVVLVVTRIGAEIAQRLGQAALVGELIAGVLLGVGAGLFSIPVLDDLGDNQIFLAITELGIFFLMLLAGIELRPRDLTESSKGSLAVAIAGTIVPMAMGMGLVERPDRRVLRDDHRRRALRIPLGEQMAQARPRRGAGVQRPPLSTRHAGGWRASAPLLRHEGAIVSG